jgi:HAMP domain-containing protein
MRRLSLSAKLLVAAVPLLLVLAALLGVLTRENLRSVDDARRGAALGAVWEPLIATIQTMEAEQQVGRSGDDAGLADARQATNQSMVGLNAAIESIGDSQTLVFQLGQTLNSIGLARAGVDATAVGTPQRDVAGAVRFDAAETSLVTLGRLLANEAGTTALANELTAVAALAEVERTGSTLLQTVEQNMGTVRSRVDFQRGAFLVRELSTSVELFQSVAPDEWITMFREGGYSRAVDDAESELEPLWAYDPSSGESVPTVDITAFEDKITEVSALRDQLADDIVTRSSQEADEARRSTYVELAVVAGLVLLAAILASLVVRSITRRVRRVSAKAHEVASTQLPALVEAMRDPRGRASLPAVAPIADKGTDEVGELAAAFDTVQSTLVDVAHEQVEVLRRGVSDIFVTMARRNRSLVDRQLALLDELEAEVEDPDVLSNYYQLDHLATRMRRNSESLLVLANSETKRRRVKATEIDDVVRAAIGEVEDYRRVDVMNLDSLQVRGDVVADVSHLLAELIDNATSFSPPESRVRVAGRHAGARYLISIADEGVGIGADRMAELNDLLAHPPVVGLSVEPTLGMSVVSLLANKHGIEVTLSPGSPGVIVEIGLPSSIYGPIDDADAPKEVPAIMRSTAREPDVLVEWIDPVPTGEVFVATEPVVAPTIATVAPLVAEPAPPVEAPEPFASDVVGGQEVVDVEPAPGATSPVAHDQDDELGLGSWDLTPSWVRDAVAEPDEAPTPVTAADVDAEPSSAPTPVSLETSAVAAEPAIEPAIAPTIAPTIAPSLPPPPPAVMSPPAGEFDRMPAPPPFGSPPALRPVVDPAARPVPPVRQPAAPTPASGATVNGLPTRARSSGNGDGPAAGALGGPDRLDNG